VVGGAVVVAAVAAVPGHASAPNPSTLTLVAPDLNWTGSAPWPNLAGCQPDDPTCDHHLLVVGDDVSADVWSVAVSIDQPGAHVAIYRLDANNQAVDIVPIGQTIVVEDSANVSAIASTLNGETIVFSAEPGRYDIEVAGSGSPLNPQHYTARARLCAGTDCSSGS
jgi:hypothetical protein